MSDLPAEVERLTQLVVGAPRALGLHVAQMIVVLLFVRRMLGPHLRNTGCKQLEGQGGDSANRQKGKGGICKERACHLQRELGLAGF